MQYSEKVAYEWLNNEGYKNVKFYPISTPDFTTDKGEFEAKMLYGEKTLVFTQNQIDFLKNSNINIIVIASGKVIDVGKIEDLEQKYKININKSYLNKARVVLEKNELEKLLEFELPQKLKIKIKKALIMIE